MEMEVEEVIAIGKELHILNMYRASLLYNWKRNENWVSQTKQKFNRDHMIIPPATHLLEPGIKFKLSKTTNLTDVSFESGVLNLPVFVVDDDTETILLNLMAFEKLHFEARSEVSSFVLFMDNLISADKDVALLLWPDEILINALGNDESVVKVFGLLGKGAFFNFNTNIANVHFAVNEHLRSPWNKWCTILKRDYFQSPWAIISLLGAIFGFVILIVQVIYQIVDYHRKGK